MKKAAQLDWEDLQQIAAMKGIRRMDAPLPLPASAPPECSSSDSEHEAGTVGVVSDVAQASVGAMPSPSNSPHDHARSGSDEKEPGNP